MRFFQKKSRKILFSFLTLAIILCPLLCSQSVHAEKGGRNAYLAVFFDESTCTYRYKTVVSGKMLEYSHVSALLPKGKLKMKQDSSKWYVHGLQMAVKESDKRECVSNVKVQDNGYVSITAAKGDKAITNYDKIKDVEEDDCLPLTFPAFGATYSEKDSQRCEAVIDTLGGDFNNALLYINDGNNYADEEYFHSMVLALISTQSGGTITNGYGHKYQIDWNEDEEMYGYAKFCTITGVSQTYQSGAQNFVYKIKKGYIGDDAFGETMENGTKNKIYITDDELRDKVKDTYWISWEHLYLEAEMLNEQGITYATRDDLYSDKTSANAFTKFIKGGIGSFFADLGVTNALDLVFNGTIYGSNAYVFGIYKDNTNSIVFTVFLAFAAIMVSLLSISVIKMINERQTIATYSSMSRANLMNDAKNMIMSLLAIAFSWQIFKLIFMLNFYFVKIWAAFLYDNYSFVYYNSTAAGDWMIEIAILIVWLYINVLYILRGIFVPILMASSPIFIYLYTLGGNFQRITMAWFKELLGAVFMQSIHAFVLTFVLMVAQDTTGITQVVVWASVIPLTKMFRDMCGLGGKELFSAAKGLSAGATAGLGAAAEAGGAVIGAGAGAAAGVGLGLAGAGIDSAVSKVNPALSTNFSSKLGELGQSVGAASGQAFGGLAKASMGAGALVASGGEDGAGVMASGISSVGNSAAQVGKSVGRLTSGVMNTNGNARGGIVRNMQNSVGPNASNIKIQNGEAVYSGPSLGVTPQMGVNGDNYATANFNTGMTMPEIQRHYEKNGLSNKSMDELTSDKDKMAKLVMTLSESDKALASGSTMSASGMQAFANSRAEMCKYMGMADLSLSTTKGQIPTKDGMKTIENVVINGGGIVKK